MGGGGALWNACQSTPLRHCAVLYSHPPAFIKHPPEPSVASDVQLMNTGPGQHTIQMLLVRFVRRLHSPARKTQRQASSTSVSFVIGEKRTHAPSDPEAFCP